MPKEAVASMTLRGETSQHPEPSFAPDDHHAVLARILAADPALAAEALANLIASERESARAEALGEAAAAIRASALNEAAEQVEAAFAAWDELGEVRAPHPLHTPAWMVERAYADAAAIVRDLANTT